MSLRAWHTYLSIFVAPSVLFFALTGALQLFGLHEAHGDYHPWAVVEKLGRLHKDQVFALKARHDPAPAAAPGTPPGGPHHDNKAPAPLATLLLKWLFLGVALALASSTCLGLWIGLTHARRRRVGWVLLGLGAVLPVILLAVAGL